MSAISKSILYGVSESAKAYGKYRLLRITDIQNNNVQWNNVPYTDFDSNKAESYLLNDGDILFARTGATVGKSYLVQGLTEKAIYASYLIRVQTYDAVLPQYIKFYFESGYYWEQIEQKSVGVGQPNVNGSILGNLQIPIPPIHEQNRIVLELTRWKDIIDAIEDGTIELESYVKQTKSKILDLAISGKLVPQDPNDEPAIELLKRINPGFKPCDNSHYENLPQGWVNLTLGDVCNFERGVTFPSSAKSTIKQSATIACIRTANVQEELDLTDLWYIGAEYIKGNPNKLVRKNDIIMSSANSRELVGKVSYVYDLSEDMTFGGFVLNIRAKECILPFYLFLILRALYLNGTYLTIATQTTNIANLNTKILSGIEVMIPSLAEQERIMKAVTQIFANIDAITAELS